MKRYASYLQTLMFFGALLLVWQYGVTFFHVKRYLFPSFDAVIVAGWEARGDILRHAIVTLTEVAAGFSAGVVGGLLLGVIVYFFAIARRTLYPLAIALQTTPKSALAPLMIVWFGYGLISKIAMAFLFAFFPILIATIGGFAGTPANLVEHFAALQASPWQTFIRLRVPAALPALIDGCKIALPLAVIGAIVGEFVGSQEGLGNLILLATASSRTDLVFAIILAVTLMSLVLYGMLEGVSRLVWWRGIHI